MKRCIATIVCLLTICSFSFSQERITLDVCHSKARENYPLIKRYELIERSREFNLSNAGKSYLPQLSLSAKATYQSEVTKIPISMPGLKVEGLSKDQYSASIDVTQTIWDGGVVGVKKEMARASATVEQKKLEVDLYTLNDRVNQLYFGILLIDAKLKQNDLLQDELQRNYDRITSYVENGVANQSDLDAVRIEQLKTKQMKTQLQSNREAYAEMLAVLIGLPAKKMMELEQPRNEELITSKINRPELELFEAQQSNLEVQQGSIKTAYMPKLGLFLTGGYGKPALNMLKNDFSPYYIGGVRLSWNFGSLYTQKNERRLIQLRQSDIAALRETFLFNLNMEATQKRQEIMKNRELLSYDDEIIALRNRVKKATEIKLANGMLTATDLLREINAEDMAIQDKIQHEIEMLLSIYNLKYTTNN